MSMPSIDSNFFSQPFPVGQMIATPYPAPRRVVAACHTRRSNGLGRFSTRIKTRRCGTSFRLRCVRKVAPLDEDGHESGLARGIAAHPELRRLAGRDRAPVHGRETVPGVLVALAVAAAVAGVALRSDVESAHCLCSLGAAGDQPDADNDEADAGEARESQRLAE